MSSRRRHSMLNYLDEFHSQYSEIHHGGRDHCSSISSEPPVIPQTLPNSSIAVSSRFSESVISQSFGQSPGSTRSRESSPKEIFEDHFQVENMEDELLNEMLQDSPAEDDVVTGLAANLILGPEPEKNPRTRETRR